MESPKIDPSYMKKPVKYQSRSYRAVRKSTIVQQMMTAIYVRERKAMKLDPYLTPLMCSFKSLYNLKCGWGGMQNFKHFRRKSRNQLDDLRPGNNFSGRKGIHPTGKCG
jgi:hypothetical protein